MLEVCKYLYIGETPCVTNPFYCLLVTLTWKIAYRAFLKILFSPNNDKWVTTNQELFYQVKKDCRCDLCRGSLMGQSSRDLRWEAACRTVESWFFEPRRGTKLCSFTPGKVQCASNINLTGGLKTRDSEPSEQSRKPTTNSTHIWRRFRESNPGYIGGRRALSPQRHSCSRHNQWPTQSTRHMRGAWWEGCM